jgi:proteasome accessory factor B
MKKLKNKSKSLENKKKSCESWGPSTRTGIERIVKMVGFLQNGNIDGEKLNASTLTKNLEVDRSTVMRDLVFLRDRLGVEFEWNASTNSYILTGDCNNFPCMELRDIDRLLFEFIENALGEVANTGLGSELQKSFRRLTSIFTGKTPKKGWGINISFAPKNPESISEFKIFNIVMGAIESKRYLQLALEESEFGEDNSYVVKPNGIEFKSGHWFLNCLLVDSGKAGLFALGKMSKAAILNVEEKNIGPTMEHISSHQEGVCSSAILTVDYSPLDDTPLKAA